MIHVKVPACNLPAIVEIHQWLVINIGKQKPNYDSFIAEDMMWSGVFKNGKLYITFRNEKDALLFKLTWC